MTVLPKKTRLIDIAQKLGVSKVTVAAALSANPNGTVRIGDTGVKDTGDDDGKCNYDGKNEAHDHGFCLFRFAKLASNV